MTSIIFPIVVFLNGKMTQHCAGASGNTAEVVKDTKVPSLYPSVDIQYVIRRVYLQVSQYYQRLPRKLAIFSSVRCNLSVTALSVNIVVLSDTLAKTSDAAASEIAFSHDALYAFRSHMLPLKNGMPLSFAAYQLRRFCLDRHFMLSDLLEETQELHRRLAGFHEPVAI